MQFSRRECFVSLLTIQGLKKYYDVKRPFRPVKTVKALDDVSLAARAKKTLGIVGESGCGKSTLAKALMRIEAPTAGEILIENKKMQAYSSKEYQSRIQMIFQDPYSSINPRKMAWQIIAEPLFINSKFKRQ